MPVPASTPALYLGRAVFDRRKFKADTDPAVIDCLALIAQTLMGAGWPSPAKTGDADIKMAVYAEDDGGGGHLLWGGNPADPLNPTPIVVSASGSATVIWQEEGSTVKTSGTVNFVGSAVTVTDEGDGKATVTITGGGGGGSTNSFTTIQVLGETDVTADTSADILTMIAGFGIDISTIDNPESIEYAFRNGHGLESDGGSPANVRVKAHTLIDVDANGVSVDFTEGSGYSGAGDQFWHNDAGTFKWSDVSDIVDDVASQVGGRLYKTTSEITAASWSGDTLTLGNGDADQIVKVTTGVYELGGSNDTIYNSVEQTIPVGKTVQCKRIDDIWVVDVEDCT